jgi:hypothetical protein
MPPKGVKSQKRKRQYENIKDSVIKKVKNTKVAKRIAAATTNKTRKEKGETKDSKSKTRTGSIKKKSTKKKSR